VQDIPFRRYLEGHTTLGSASINDALSRVRRWEKSFNCDLDDYLDHHSLDAAVDRCRHIPSNSPRSIHDVRTALRHYSQFRETP